ncbi:MAG: winged helix-turn-helix transcriptional regulator [Pseudobacteriovorax sp.]|nr:winged helix-turn-helix transcriptional regulator [Pseudobacteriovorax sp.]
MDQSSRKFRLLANPIRRKVLMLLIDAPYNVSQLISRLSIEQSLLSHHLGLLRKEGLVLSTRIGKEIVYAINPAVRDDKKQVFKLGCCDIRL